MPTERDQSRLLQNQDILRSVILTLEPEYFYDFQNYWNIYQEMNFIKRYQEFWKERLQWDELPLLDQIYYAAVFHDRPLLESLMKAYEARPEFENEWRADQDHETLSEHQKRAYEGAAASGWDQYINEPYQAGEPYQAEEPYQAGEPYQAEEPEVYGENIKPIIMASVRFDKDNYLHLLDNITDEHLHIEAIVEAILSNHYKIFIKLLDSYDNNESHYNRYKLAIAMLEAERFNDFTFTEDEIDDYVGKETEETLAVAKTQTDKDYLKKQMEILRTVMEYALDNNVYFNKSSEIDKERYYNTKNITIEVPYNV